jgi:hypothetical protein
MFMTTSSQRSVAAGFAGVALILLLAYTTTTPPSSVPVAKQTSTREPFSTVPISLPPTTAADQPLRRASPGGDPHVGFCFSGGARSLSLTAQSILTNVVDAIQPDRSRRAVIFNLQTTNDCDANPVNTLEAKQECAAHLTDSVAMINSGKVEAMFGATIFIDNALTCDHPFAKNHSECCRKRHNALADHNLGGLWSYSQVLRRRICIGHLRDEEQKRGRRFDYIVLMRPDMFFWELSPPATYLKGLPRVLATSKERGQPPADYLYLMPREFLDDFDGSLYDVFDNYCATDRWDAFGMPPEFRFMEWITRRQVPFQVFPFQCTIVRSRTMADCDRLDSEVLKVATVRHNDALMPLHELCRQLFPRNTGGGGTTQTRGTMQTGGTKPEGVRRSSRSRGRSLPTGRLPTTFGR